MPEIGKLTEIQQGTIHIQSVTGDTIRPASVQVAIVDFGVDPYEGPYTVTPGDATVTLETRDLRMTENVTIAAIPSNYGKIGWNGSALTVS